MFTKKTLRIFVNIIQETGNHVSWTGSGVGVRGPMRGGVFTLHCNDVAHLVTTILQTANRRPTQSQINF